MSFPRYPAYRDSGVEWLGQIPAHWEVVRLKRIASMASGDSIPAEKIAEEGDFPVFGGNGLRGYTSGFTHDGTFALIGRQGALCGNIHFARGKFWASEHALVVDPIGTVDTSWLGEMLRAMNLQQYSISAAQPGLSVETLGSMRTVVPPPSEQRAIGTFIRVETTAIDALIAEQERLIELLKEKLQATITRAVTKGLDPDAPMKPSGVEWLGDVPAHWEVRRLASLFQEVSEEGREDLPILSVSIHSGVSDRVRGARPSQSQRRRGDAAAFTRRHRLPSTALLGGVQKPPFGYAGRRRGGRADRPRSVARCEVRCGGGDSPGDHRPPARAPRRPHIGGGDGEDRCAWPRGRTAGSVVPRRAVYIRPWIHPGMASPHRSGSVPSLRIFRCSL